MTIDNAISDLIELKICGVVPFTKGTISGGNYKVITGDCLDEAIDTMRKYQMLQADYEERLKADMVAMLEELDFRLSNYQDTDLIRQDIQEKIDKLKEVSE